jgi:spore coat polysaccharide biosynthesis protein SpsF
LGTAHLATVLLHRSQHRHAWGGAVWQRLLELKSESVIGVLGVSVYDPPEALEALQDSDIQHVQIPMNVLDWRWKAQGVDRALSHRPDVVVHARSAFLQGILLHAPDWWPETDYDAQACVNQLRVLVRLFERESIADLCLAYIRSQPWITSIVVGCETMAQLQQNLSLFRRSKMSNEQCEEVEHSLPKAPESLLNPAKWKVTHVQPAAR